MKKAILILMTFAGLVGCADAKQGPAGPAGVSGRVVSSIFCQGVTSSMPSASLNGLTIEYNGVITNSGDVFASANIIDEYQQISGTSFYAAGDSGAATGSVYVTADHYGSADGAYWKVSVNRSTGVTTVVFTDPVLGSGSGTFPSSGCTIHNY